MMTIFDKASGLNSRDIILNIAIQFLIMFHINDNAHIFFDNVIFNVRLVLHNVSMSMMTIMCSQRTSLIIHIDIVPNIS